MKPVERVRRRTTQGGRAAFVTFSLAALVIAAVVVGVRTLEAPLGGEPEQVVDALDHGIDPVAAGSDGVSAGAAPRTALADPSTVAREDQAAPADPGLLMCEHIIRRWEDAGHRRAEPTATVLQSMGAYLSPGEIAEAEEVDRENRAEVERAEREFGVLHMRACQRAIRDGQCEDWDISLGLEYSMTKLTDALAATDPWKHDRVYVSLPGPRDKTSRLVVFLRSTHPEVLDARDQAAAAHAKRHADLRALFQRAHEKRQRAR